MNQFMIGKTFRINSCIIFDWYDAPIQGVAQFQKWHFVLQIFNNFANPSYTVYCIFPCDKDPHYLDSHYPQGYEITKSDIHRNKNKGCVFIETQGDLNLVSKIVLSNEIPDQVEPKNSDSIGDERVPPLYLIECLETLPSIDRWPLGDY